MLCSLTILDRIVIESFKKDELSFEQLIESTGVDAYILKNTLESLIEMRLINLKSNRYFLSDNIKEQLRNNFSNCEDIISELNDITYACIQSTIRKENKKFNLKKVYLNEQDEKIYQSMIYNLESFLDSLKNKNNKTYKTQIIFWGGDSYENICNSIINS